tara:strand:+ start:1552 stop:3645 length:2094 start_codon:yes stop_codon:yes gene_type:complete
VPTDIEKLIQPSSIAVIGASADYNKLNGRVMKFLIDHGFSGEIYPVNPKYDIIGGLKCYSNIDDLPKPADLAVITVPAHSVVKAVESCGLKGIKAAVLFSSGFKEIGGKGAALEATLVATAKRVGVRICGPNTIGLINCFDNAFASFSQYGYGKNIVGSISFISQSGAFGTAIAALARDRGIGLGYFISTGNECDLSIPEIAYATLKDPRIDVITCYVEGLKHGENWISLAELALASSKPIVVTKVGRSAAGKRAAASHTGSLAGADEVFDGFSEQYGLIRARNEEHMLDLADAFMLCDLPEGRGVGIITQSGGAGVMMTDRAVELGLNVPKPCRKVMSAIKEIIPSFGSANNPIDVTAQFLINPEVLRDSIIRLFDDPDIHIGVVWLQLMHDHVDLLINIFEQTKLRAKKPFLVAWVGASDETIKKMRAIDVCCLRGGDPAIDAVAALVQFSEAKCRYKVPITENRGKKITGVSLMGHSGIVPSDYAGDLLSKAGVSVPKHKLCKSSAAAVAAAKQFGPGVVLKIESPDIHHKTDVGGVKLALTGRSAIEDAYAEIISTVAANAPNARIDGILVEEMVEPATELVIGLKRDPTFGNVIMVGLGGIFVEIIKDVAIRLCPVTIVDAHHMLDNLKCSEILDGTRGSQAANKEQIAQMIVDVSELGSALKDSLVELDLNPVFVSVNSAIAVDWLMVAEK